MVPSMAQESESPLLKQKTHQTQQKTTNGKTTSRATKTKANKSTQTHQKQENIKTNRHAQTSETNNMKENTQNTDPKQKTTQWIDCLGHLGSAHTIGLISLHCL